jgi:hypothetical protein
MWMWYTLLFHFLSYFCCLVSCFVTAFRILWLELENKDIPNYCQVGSTQPCPDPKKGPASINWTCECNGGAVFICNGGTVLTGSANIVKTCNNGANRFGNCGNRLYQYFNIIYILKVEILCICRFNRCANAKGRDADWRAISGAQSDNQSDNQSDDQSNTNNDCCSDTKICYYEQ